MKKVILVLSLFLFNHVKAQDEDQPKENPSIYFNAFQTYLYDHPNGDSALYCLQKLALNSASNDLLKELLHNFFAQEFRQNNAASSDTDKTMATDQKLLFCKRLLAQMVSDTNSVLQNAVRPLNAFVKAQDNSSNPAVLANIANDFIENELAKSDLFENRQGRYGLLIHRVLLKHSTLKPLAEKLLFAIKSNLESKLVNLTDSTSRMDLDRRAWNRYLYAYINHLQATNTTDRKSKALLLKAAYDFSPDLIDRNHHAAYFYDMIFLVGREKEGFREDYLNYLTSTSTDKQAVISALLEAALAAPEYKDRLKEYYSKTTSAGTSFESFWAAAISKKAKAAPSISLNLLDGKPFRSKDLMGKWVLVDFWGTWCVPCRAEHPDLEKFYQTIVRQNPNAISLLTIACRDEHGKVSAYMEQKKYTFPVAMSDNKIETAYSVQGYPTKILITPEGKYIVIPFGVDWIDFVKRYSGL